MAASAFPLDEPAPEGRLYFCGACGRRSRTRSGYTADGKPAWLDDGWTGICTPQSSLLPESEIDVARLRAGIIEMKAFCVKYGDRISVCERDATGPKMQLLSELSPERLRATVAIFEDHWNKTGWVPTPDRR